MKLRNLALTILLALCPLVLQAQVYRNAVNARFNTVATGPMQAIIVDVPAQADSRAINNAVLTRVAAVRKARASAAQRQFDTLTSLFHWKRALSPGIPDIVILRQNGKLILPSAQSRAARDTNDVVFRFPDSTQNEPGAWPADKQATLLSLINMVKPQLMTVYGAPAWSGTVTLVDQDRLTPALSDRNALSGGVFNASTNQILFAEYNHLQSVVMNLTQMMAIAFRGPAGISYDAWERGMARAATIVTVSRLVNSGALTDVDPSDPLWHALDFYDLLNQPALANDRFFPLSKDLEAVGGDFSNVQFGSGDFGGMIYPRLQMSGSAWLKVHTQDPAFFATFNAAYYAALAGNPNLKNDVPALKQIARAAVLTDTASANVEGMDFLDWYQRQYVLDTSVSLGTKLYAWTIPVRPESGKDNYSVATVLIYYRTALDSTGNSDEVNLSATCYPVYWDYTYLNRLFLQAQYERIDVRDGQGTVSPEFFNTLGGDPALSSKMRITMDFPVNRESARVYVAPRSMGTDVAPSNFWGTVVGADTGTMRITMGGVSQDFPVQQGAFGGVFTLGNNVDPFGAPGKATLTFTDSSNHVTTRQVNTGYREYACVFYASDPLTTRTSPTLPAGPALISFPIQPVQQKAALALLDPTSGNPLFTDSNLLLAQWRQDLTTDDKYQRYPNMDALQPGRGYWSNFPSAITTKITGKVADLDADYTTGLTYGWNMIGNPYTTAVSVDDLVFQYQSDPTGVSTATAVANGWLGGNVPGLGTVTLLQYSSASGYAAATTLQPWNGYWIRVNVTEGLTVTFPSPSRAAARNAATRAAVRSTKSAAIDGWVLPITVRGTDGYGSTAYIGQSSVAATGYDPKMDVLSPPAVSRSMPNIVFPHSDWGTNSGDYLIDVRRTGARNTWTFTAYTPDPTKTYTLTWPTLQKVPSSVRLVLVDQSTGVRKYLQTTSSYSFSPGNSSSRSFQVIAENRTANALRILNLTTNRTRAFGGTGLDISFDLTQGASVTAEIRDARGRVIRHLSAGRAVDAGSNHLGWDSRDDKAAAVPIGAYMVQVTAQTAEGETSRAIQPVLVVR